MATMYLRELVRVLQEMLEADGDMPVRVGSDETRGDGLDVRGVTMRIDRALTPDYVMILVAERP